MRLVITGASGFVGRALVTAADAAGHRGVATGRSVPPDLPGGWVGALRGAVLAEGAAAPADALIHLETRHHADGGEAADTLAGVIVGGTREWLAWAARHEVETIVYASSVLAVARPPGPIGESAAPETVAPYGAAKAAAEAEVRRWAEERPGRRAVILRPAPVYGPDPRSNLVAFVRRVAAGKRSLIGAGGARKSILARENLVAALLHAATGAAAGCTVYNVADREQHTIAELAAIVADVCGAPAPRSAPLWLARLAAPVADAIQAVSGRDLPLSSARLRAATAPGHFPCDRLLATGFRHPLSSREGLRLLVEHLGLGRPRRRGAGPDAPGC